MCGGSGKIEIEEIEGQEGTLGGQTVKKPKKRAPRAKWPGKK